MRYKVPSEAVSLPSKEGSWIRVIVNGSSEREQQAAPLPLRVLPQDTTGSQERWPCSNSINSKTDALQEMALGVRGGGAGGDDEASVMTLFIRVLLPGFGREKKGDGELDLEGGGLLRRLKRLVSGVFRKVAGSRASAGSKGEMPDQPRLVLCRLCHAQLIMTRCTSLRVIYFLASSTFVTGSLQLRMVLCRSTSRSDDEDWACRFTAGKEKGFEDSNRHTQTTNNCSILFM